MGDSLQNWNLRVSPEAIVSTPIWFGQTQGSMRFILENELLKRGTPGLSCPEQGQPRIRQTRTDDSIAQRSAIPSWRHPGQPHVWWECRQRSLYLLGLQGARTWAHSEARREAREHIREGSTLSPTGSCLERSLKNIWPLSKHLIFSHVRQTLRVNTSFQPRYILCSKLHFLYLIFMILVFKTV